jgi:undecaprenyl pyrophosphate phosphatase UppP
MVVALGSINAMMAILQRVGFMPFVIYRVILGLGLLAMVYLG